MDGDAPVPSGPGVALGVGLGAVGDFAPLPFAGGQPFATNPAPCMSYPNSGPLRYSVPVAEYRVQSEGLSVCQSA